MAGNNEFYRLNLVLQMEDRLSGSLRNVDRQVEHLERAFERAQRSASRLSGTNTRASIRVDTSRIETALNRVAQRLEHLNGRTIRPNVAVNDQATRPLNTVNRNLRETTGRRWNILLGLKDGVSSQLSSIRSTLLSPLGMLGAGAAGFGVGGFLVDSAKKAMDFSHEIANIKALTNMGSDELEQVRQKALQLGASTQFSSIEAAQGMSELLKAGMSVEQVMNGASDAALNLAAAGELSLPEAAEIMSTSMNAFHMTDAAHAADVLTGAANASATSVQEMRFSLAAVSAVAAGVGMSFDDTNTALAVFAQNGFKGSDAGTSLKTMLMRLEPTTNSQIEAFQRLGLMTENGTSAFYDAEGRMKSLAEIADLLHTSMKDLNPEEQQRLLGEMFGSDAIRGGGILMREGAEGVKKMQEEMTKFTASGVAKTKWESAKGDIVRLKSAFENFQITALAPLEPAIAKVSKALTDFFSDNAEGAAEVMGNLSSRISSFVDELAGDEKFQKMDWGDKVVYILDKMMNAISNWASGPGGQQFGKVMTKLAEIGMRAFLAVMKGLIKGAFSSLFSGNFIGAAGLGALAASMPGVGLVAGGLAKAAKKIFYNRPAPAGEAAAGEAAGAARGAGRWNWGRMGKAAKWAGRIATPIQAFFDAKDLAESTPENRAETVGGIAGHWAGAAAGAKAGAIGGGAIGGFFGGVGAAPGAAIGGLLGGIGGFFAGDKLGADIGKAIGDIDFSGLKEKLAGVFDFSSMGETISEGLSSVGEEIGNFFSTLPEQAGFATGYIVEVLAQLPGRVSEIFSQLVEEIGTYLSALPGRIAEWFSETATAVVQWFEQLPGRVSAKMSELYTAAVNWCSQTIAGIRSWFSQLPGIIAGAFDSAIATIKSKAAAAWSYVNSLGSRFSAGFGEGRQAARGYAYGGFVDKEGLVNVAEGGRLEAIIPMDPAKRTRGIELWERAGQILGMRPQDADEATSNGSIIQQVTQMILGRDLFSGTGSLQPSVASAYSGSNESRSGDSYTFNGMKIQVGNNLSEEGMALAIGRRILAEIQQGFENRG